MKLIQIFALTAALAGMAAGQNSPKSPQPAATPAKSPAATGSPAPATKANPAKKADAKSTSAPAKTSPATKKAPATTKAGAQSAPAKTAGATTAPAKTTGAQTAPAKTAGATTAPATKSAGAPASKSGTAPASKPPAVAVGTLPPQKGTKAGKSAAAKGTKKAVPTAVAKRAPGSKPASSSKGTRPSVARVEPAPRAEPKPATPAKLLGAAGRRDPFVSPIRSASSVSPTAACTSGKRCLAIPELILQGTVRDVSGKMMAVVTTSNRRTYTLRENDQVFNGSVEKITSDSIIFREYVRDPLGRESAREVVKKLGPTT